MQQLFSIVKDRLLSKGYEVVQYLPTRRSVAIGQELFVFRSFFFHSSACIFHSTCFYGIYHRMFKNRHPEQYELYRIFFLNESTCEEVILKLFSKGEIDQLVEGAILVREGTGYRFNYRFVPFEGLIMVGKVDIRAREYAHLNYDSVTFVQILRRMLRGRRFRRAIEVGCGAGLVSTEISRFADRVDAIDINPHAVNIMRINAGINNINNITAIESNYYDKTNGLYDLVISDPPFELMPDGEKDILHRYGGSLGMEIALRIVDGLESVLEKGGEAIMFTNSYIRNGGENTLVDAMKKMFDGKRFRLVFNELSYQINPDFYHIYRREKISYSIAYIIHIKRSDQFSAEIVPLGIIDAIRERIRVAYLYFGVLIKNGASGVRNTIVKA